MQIIKKSLQNLFRNNWLSVINILVMLLMLFSISFIYGINQIGEQTLSSMEQKMDMGIYLKQDANQETIASLTQELKSLKFVKNIKYYSPAETLEQFKEKHKGDEIIQDSLKQIQENPLGGTINLSFQDSSQYSKVTKILEKPNFSNIIQNKDFHDYQEIINSFNNVTQKISLITIIISIFFILIAILVIFNTIKLGAISRKKEIKIMRLVGAESKFIRGPFLLESAIYALIAWIINLGLLLTLSFYTSDYLKSFLGFDFDLYNFFTHQSTSFFIGLLIFAIIISMIGGSLAIKKYLKA